MTTPIRMVYTTTDDGEVAGRLAKTMIERRLAACVKIVPKVSSYYRWEDKVQCDSEYWLVIKTHHWQVANLKQFISEQHNYDSPEFIVTEIVDGLESYLDWVEVQTKP